MTLKDKYNIPLKTDKNSMLGRRCPRKECKRFFKIKDKDYAEFQNKEIFCPTCGFKESGNNMVSYDQIEFAKSLVMKDAMDYINNSFKGLERKSDPRSLISFKVTPGKIEIKDYIENELDKTVTCEKCNKTFAICSVSSFCPFCGPRDPAIIFEQNTELAKQFSNLQNIITGQEKNSLQENGIFDKLIEKALDTTVTAFETYCKSKYVKKIIQTSSDSEEQILKQIRNSFQNLDETAKLFGKFGIDVKAILGTKNSFVAECFEKRHVFIHNSGIIDQRFIDRTGSKADWLGKKIIITQNDIDSFITGLRELVTELENKL